jgi:hypothetical protein
VTPHPEPVAAPSRTRRVALLVMVITSLMGLMSTAEALGLGKLDQHRQRIQDDAQRLTFLGDPGLLAAANEAQMSALEGMKATRGLVLGALASACLVAFFSALRLLRPHGVAREALRRVLVVSLIAAAVLRTVDGAQWAVVAQRSIRAVLAHMQELDLGQGNPIAVPESFAQPVTLAMVLVHTAVVAGSLLLLAQYFRSEKVKKLVALQDQQMER